MLYKNLENYKQCLNNKSVDKSQIKLKKIKKYYMEKGQHLFLFFLTIKDNIMMKLT